MNRDKVADKIHKMAQEAGIVVLVWTPKDVKELLNDDTISEETAQAMLAGAEDLHEHLWSSAKRYFEQEHFEQEHTARVNNDLSKMMEQLTMLAIHMSELKSQLNLIEDAIVNDDRNN